jgi:hypothetical protein
MTGSSRTIWRGLLLTILLTVCTNNVVSQRLVNHKGVKERQNKPLSEIADKQSALAKQSQGDFQVRLKLTDGTNISVDDARESEQGIWYKQTGVTYLIPRERVQAIERTPPGKSKGAPDVAKIPLANPPQKLLPTQPVWIYLTGGALVEADSAIESSAGVWYRRGSLTIFIEGSRVERVEREDLESTKESDSSIKERGWTTGNAKIDSLIKQSGAKYGVDPYLIFCVMEQESHFSARVVSPKGARGLMQLMPGTSSRFGVRHPFNPGENISAGARYLKQLLDQFKGRVDLVLASYNAGEGAVIKYGHKVPPYRETREYVKKISYRYRRGG